MYRAPDVTLTIPETTPHGPRTVCIMFDEANDLLEFQEIMLDEDESAACNFLKEKIASHLPEKSVSPCNSANNIPFIR